jgi:hypothetical protein
VKVDPKLGGERNIPMLSGQMNVPMLGGQKIVPILGGQKNVPMLSGQRNVPMFGGQWKEKETVFFHLFPLSPPSNLFRPSFFFLWY